MAETNLRQLRSEAEGRLYAWANDHPVPPPENMLFDVPGLGYARLFRGHQGLWTVQWFDKMITLDDANE